MKAPSGVEKFYEKLFKHKFLFLPCDKKFLNNHNNNKTTKTFIYNKEKL